MWLLYQMVFHAIPLPFCHFSIHFHKVTGISTPVLFFISLNKCSSSRFFHFSFILICTSFALFTSLFSFPSPSHPQNFHLVSPVLTSCLQKASLVSSYITFYSETSLKKSVSSWFLYCLPSGIRPFTFLEFRASRPFPSSSHFSAGPVASL